MGDDRVESAQVVVLSHRERGKEDDGPVLFVACAVLIARVLRRGAKVVVLPGEEGNRFDEDLVLAVAEGDASVAGLGRVHRGRDEWVDDVVQSAEALFLAAKDRLIESKAVLLSVEDRLVLPRAGIRGSRDVHLQSQAVLPR